MIWKAVAFIYCKIYTFSLQEHLTYSPLRCRVGGGPQRSKHRRKTHNFINTRIHVHHFSIDSTYTQNRDPSFHSDMPLHPTKACIPLHLPFLLLLHTHIHTHTHNLNKPQLRGLVWRGKRSWGSGCTVTGQTGSLVNRVCACVCVRML